MHDSAVVTKVRGPDPGIVYAARLVSYGLREVRSMVSTFDNAAWATYFAAIVLLWYIARQFSRNKAAKPAA